MYLLCNLQGKKVVSSFKPSKFKVDNNTELLFYMEFEPVHSRVIVWHSTN